MKSVIVYTPYDCIIKVGDEQTELSQNEHLLLDDRLDTITVYPVGRTERYAFTVDFFAPNSTFYRIVEKDDKLLVFLLDGILCESCEVHKFQYKGKEFSVEIGKDSIFFASESRKSQICLVGKPQNVNYGHFLHIAYALFSQNDEDVILLYNIYNGKMRKCIGDKITLTQNGFIVNNHNRDGFENIEQEYTVDNDGLKCLRQEALSSETPLPEDLTAFQFMSAVKNKNYSLAHSMLHSDLQEKISAKALQTYFGDITYNYMLDDSTCFALSGGQNVIYEFIVQNGQIMEITDNKA